MGMVIQIDGDNRTDFVEYSSLKIIQILTQEPDRCEFLIRKFGDRTYSPTVNEEVIVTQDGTKIFAGHIIDIDEIYGTIDDISYRVHCSDYTRMMDSRLIINTYENQTVAQIIQDIKDTYLPNSVTIDNVDVDTLIDYVAFNYEYPSDAFRQLAEATQSDWYIDYDKDIHFFHQSEIEAPFGLTDTGGKYIYESLNIRRDLSQLKNVIFVRGGEFLGTITTVEFLGDATRDTFFLPNKFSNLTLTTTGQEKSVGTDPIDDPSLFDAVHNFQEKFVRFRSDKIPSDAASVRIGGNPNLPVITKMRDTESIETFTAREALVIDKSINTKEGARQRAISELIGYKSTISEGEFRTYETTLRTGQKINVQSDNRGIDDDFIINKIESTIFGTDASDGSVKLINRVSLITTRTFDHIQFLKSLINSKRKEIVIDPNEILDEVESVSELFTFSETIVVSVSHNPIAESMALSEVFTSDGNYGEEYVVGLWTSGRDEDTPSVKKRQFLISGSPLS